MPAARPEARARDAERQVGQFLASALQATNDLIAFVRESTFIQTRGRGSSYANFTAGVQRVTQPFFIQRDRLHQAALAARRGRDLVALRVLQRPIEGEEREALQRLYNALIVMGFELGNAGLQVHTSSRGDFVRRPEAQAQISRDLRQAQSQLGIMVDRYRNVAASGLGALGEDPPPSHLMSFAWVGLSIVAAAYFIHTSKKRK